MIYPLPITLVFKLGGLFARRIKGLENIPKKGPFIVASNHESYLDPFIVTGVLLPRLKNKVHWLAMKGRFWKLFGDRISKDWVGCVPLNQGKEKALNELTGLLKDGEHVGIFPGGQRSLNGNLTRGRTGISRLVLGAHVPVIPMGLIDTYEIAPRERLFPRFKRADVKIGNPMYFDKYYNKPVTKKMLREMADKVMVEIAKLTKKRYEF